MASTLDSSSNKLGQILADRDGILRQLEDDPILKNDLVAGSPPMDTDAILKRETELSSELRDLNSLKTISSLILEFRTNLELFEFENCFYSLKHLRRKLHDDTTLSRQSYGLQRSVITYVDNLHLDLVSSISSILDNGFWKSDKDSISFRQSIPCGKEKIELHYVEFLQSVETLFFSEGHLGPKLWVISEITSGTTQEQVRAKLNTILREHIKMIGLIDRIKSSIFAQDIWIRLEIEQKKLTFEESVELADDKLKGILSSLKDVAYFLADVTVERDRDVLAEALGPILSKELTKCVRKNALVVFRPENAQMRDRCQDICLKLKELSHSCGTWTYDAAELDRLFNSNEIPLNLQVDRILQDQLLDLRTFFSSKDWSTLTPVPSTDSTTEASKETVNRKRYSSSSRKSLADDWNWEEDAADSGWNEQIDLDLDDVHSHKSKKGNNSEAADDAWDDAWDVDIDEDEEQASLEHPISNSSQLQTTKLPGKIIQLVGNFKKRSYETSHGKLDEHHYRYKLNVLETSIMAMAERHFRNNWWQLYVDLKYLEQKDQSLLRLQELTLNYLELYLKSREAVVYRLVCEQLDELWNNEEDPAWAVTVEQLLPFIQEEVLKPLSLIGKTDSARCLASFLNFLYNDCIVENILKCKIISERNSENLSKFIALIYSKTEIAALKEDASYRETREKFTITGKLLPLHLKEIMEMFYSGDFYLFTTNELVKWIILLFAETPLRRNAIEDIHEIRNTNVDG